jgi:hypothetical protein
MFLRNLKKIILREPSMVTQEERDKLLESIGRIYQNVLQNPMINIDQMWKDYCQFESVIYYIKKITLIGIQDLIFFLNLAILFEKCG